MTSASDANDAELQALRRENQRLRRAVEELSILNELATAIGGSHDVQAIMKTVIRRSLQAVQAEQGVITLVSDEPARDRDPLETFIRTASHSGDYQPLRPSQSLMSWMNLHKRPLLLNNPRQDDRFRGTPWDASTRSLLCVPLLLRAQLAGILTVYNKKAGKDFTEDDQRLLAIIAAQAAFVIENARLFEEEKKLLRMQEEVRLAYQIQTDLLPKEAPSLPGYEVAGLSLPAQTVGGDYFDYIPIDEDRIALCVGDVVGKGLPASLMMANVQATLRGQALASRSVAECLERSNRLLYQSISKSAFVTLFYGVLDTRRGHLCYVNAGHNRPLLLTGDEQPVPLLPGGLVLGAVAEVTYQEERLLLQPGDLLLIYSDGATEAINAAREQFGEERLSAVLQQHRQAPVRDVIEAVVRAVRQHAGATPQADDITLLALRRLAEG